MHSFNFCAFEKHPNSDVFINYVGFFHSKTTKQDEYIMNYKLRINNFKNVRVVACMHGLKYSENT